MSQLVQLGRQRAARPSWLRVRAAAGDQQREVAGMVAELNLTTVCQEARCPNIGECWGLHRTATFMILGDICTRACRYCSVRSGRPQGPPDAGEPERVGEAVARLGLRHAVITSVDRDDLPDYGAGHFVATMQAIRARRPDCRIELLVPDFMGDAGALAQVLRAAPAVLNHNTETVPRLYRRLRSRGVYRRTLEVLGQAARHRAGGGGSAMTTKSGLMVGLGETVPELLAVMDDLRAVDCDVLTLGQYLTPTAKHVPIERYYRPEEFEELRQQALQRGFHHVEAGPLVRSSYHAHQHVPAPATPG